MVKAEWMLTNDPQDVTRGEALTAIRYWMGSYEGRSGTQLADLLEDGVSDEALTADDGEGIPADMVAGYRYALQQERAQRRESQATQLARRAARAAHKSDWRQYLPAARQVVRQREVEALSA